MTPRMESDEVLGRVLDELHESNAHAVEIGGRLAKIEAKLDVLEAGGPLPCLRHAEKLDLLVKSISKVEIAQGKQSAIVLTLGALGAGAAFFVKWMVSWRTHGGQ